MRTPAGWRLTPAFEMNPSFKKNDHALALVHYTRCEWQIKGIQDALIEADSQDAVFVDHQEVLAQREAKFVC